VTRTTGSSCCPHRPEAGRCEKGDHRLRDVGQVTDHTIASADTEFAQGGRECGDLAPELAPGHEARGRPARLRFVDEGGGILIDMPQHLVDIV
jgi:hypothetical protein